MGAELEPEARYRAKQRTELPLTRLLLLLGLALELLRFKLYALVEELAVEDQ